MRSESAPDLLAAMRPSVDPIRQGERILAAIEALDAPALAALFTPPRSLEFQQRLEKLWLLREAILERAMARWLDLDLAGALAWLPEAPACFPSNFEEFLDVCVERVLAPVAKKFPQEAVAFALGMPAGSRKRQDTARSVICAITRTSPALAREMAARFSDEAARQEAMGGYFHALAETDPLAVLSQARAMASKTALDQAVSGIQNSVRLLTPRQVEEICEQLGEGDWMKVVDRFAFVHPAAAARLAARLCARPEPGKSPPQISWMVGTQYGRSDGPGAIEWARALPEEMRSSALRSVAEGWAEKDPAAAVRGLGELLPEGSEREAALTGAMQPWIDRDFSAALAWLDALPPGNLRAVAERVAIERLPEVGREEESLLRFSQIEPDETKPISTTRAEDGLASRDPRRLAEWCVYFAEKKRPFSSLQTVVGDWFTRDPGAAAQWATALPAGAARDDAAVGCAYAASQMDGAAAVEWVKLVADPRRRSFVANVVCDMWRKREPQAARKWYEQFTRSEFP